jgi:hypothetical protein
MRAFRDCRGSTQVLSMEGRPNEKDKERHGSSDVRQHVRAILRQFAKRLADKGMNKPTR